MKKFMENCKKPRGLYGKIIAKMMNSGHKKVASWELSHLEITNAYATLASEGVKHEPFFIRKVTDITGKIIYEHKDTSEVVLNKSTTFILNDLLKGTYDASMIDYTYPTNISIASQLTKNYAIKSGSTDTDNWIVGYNDQVTTLVWIGYDDNRIMTDNDFKYSIAKMLLGLDKIFAYFLISFRYINAAFSLALG